MKIVLCGGYSFAEPFILQHPDDTLIWIDPDPVHCGHIRTIYEIETLCADPLSPGALELAQVEGCDLLVALLPCERDNLTLCQRAMERFHVRATIALARDDYQGAVLREYGVSEVLLAPRILADSLTCAIARTMARAECACEQGETLE